MIEIRQMIENNWVDINVTEIKDVSNSGFFNNGVFKIYTEDKRALALKGYGDKKDLVFFTNSVSLLLFENGFDGIPKLEKTKSGQYFSQNNSNYYTITNWVEGTSLNHVAPNYRHNKLRQAASSLGQLHMTSDRFIYLLEIR